MAIALIGNRHFVFTMIDELVKFAKGNHPGFAVLPNEFLQNFFEKYKATTIVSQSNGEIKSFGVYQEWPDRLVFLAVVAKGNQIENIRFFLKLRRLRPIEKMLCFFDETRMELRQWRL